MPSRTGRLLGLGAVIVSVWWVAQYAFASAAARPTTHAVTIENMAFAPATLRIQLGDEVNFKNSDLVPHTVTAKRSGGFDSGILPAGASWSLRPAAVGVLDYVCTLHPTMTGTIVVEQRSQP